MLDPIFPAGDRPHVQLRVESTPTRPPATPRSSWPSGAAGPVDLAEFERRLDEVASSLTKQIARDGEGAEKLIEVTRQPRPAPAQAKRVAKAIVNSPLVKTAVHGADPNWGRVAMAIGKCDGDEIANRLRRS